MPPLLLGGMGAARCLPYTLCPCQVADLAQEPALAAQAFDFARLRAEVFPRSARAQYALALAAHDRKETGLFEEASARTLELLPTDDDPTLDAATRERMRAEIGGRRSP